MKLYYFPGACSLAAHVALREAGIPFTLDKVDLATKKTEDGDDFLAVNPKGYVPALLLDDGQILTEDQVILQYLADLKPDSGLTPKFGSIERYRLMEWLAFIATEIHKSFGPLWNPKSPEETRQAAIDLLGRRFDYLDGHLSDREWLCGDHFTVADAYLCTVLGWAAYHRMDLSKWPSVAEYAARVTARPSVQQAMRAEGLV